MLLARLLRHDRVCLEMETSPLPAHEREAMGARWKRVEKESALEEIAAFLEATSPVGSEKRLRTDLIHRERKASTATGRGLAIPHVRTMNVKEPVVAFLRSTPGLEFDSPDDLPVHVFLVLVAPPWDDKLYLKVYREAAQLFLRDDVLPWLLEATDATQVLQFFRSPEKFVVDW